MTKIEWSVIHCLASMDTLTTSFQWLPLYHPAVYLGLLAALVLACVAQSAIAFWLVCARFASMAPSSSDQKGAVCTATTLPLNSSMSAGAATS